MEREELMIEVLYSEFIDMARKAALFDALREYNMRSDVAADDTAKALLGLNYKPAAIYGDEPYRCVEQKEEARACCV